MNVKEFMTWILTLTSLDIAEHLITLGIKSLDLESQD
jgi:hypothetical protein